MNLIYIVENYGTISETFVSSLVEYLSKNSSRFSVITSINNKQNLDHKSENINVIETNFANRFKIIRRPIEILFSKMGFGVFSKNLNKLLAKISIKTKIKSIAPDIAYIDFGFNALLVRKTLEDLNVPYIVHFHGVDATAMFSSRYYEEEMGKVFNGAEKIITASNHIRRRLIIYGCPEKKIQVVRLGIDIDKIDKIIQRNNKTKFPSFIHVGRLVDKKSPLPILFSFKKILKNFPKAKFYIIGDGPEFPRIKNFIKKLELNNSVTLYGSRNSDFVWKKMAECWVFVQHSCTSNRGDQEGFSVGILEASFCGLPVISTIHNGIPENIIEGKTGFLVQEHDYSSFALKMEKLLNDKTLRQSIGKAGELNVRKKYFIEKRGMNILNILKQSI